MIRRIACIGAAVVLTTCLAPCQQTTADGTPEPERKRMFWDCAELPDLSEYPGFRAANDWREVQVASEDSFDRGIVALAAIFAGQSQLTNANRLFGRGSRVRTVLRHRVRRFRHWKLHDRGRFPHASSSGSAVFQTRHRKRMVPAGLCRAADLLDPS